LTPKFSLIIGIAVAALVLAAPAAAVFPTVDGGDSGYSGEAAGSVVATAPDFWNYDANGNKVANASPGVAPEDLATTFGGVRDASEASTQPTIVTAGSTSREWRHEEIGLAAGVALLLGFLLVARHVRIRQVAH
jgi:hypothetical protein